MMMWEDSLQTRSVCLTVNAHLAFCCTKSSSEFIIRVLWTQIWRRFLLWLFVSCVLSRAFWIKSKPAEIYIYSSVGKTSRRRGHGEQFLTTEASILINKVSKKFTGATRRFPLCESRFLGAFGERGGLEKSWWFL